MKTCKLCDSTISSRELCMKHYMQHRRAGTLDEISPMAKPAPKWVHRVSGVNSDTGEALCKECGPIVARKTKRGPWECTTPTKKRKKIGKTYYASGKPIPSGHVKAARERFADQKTCMICNSDGPLKLDHCHQSGVFRGYLCNRCNVGLGWFDDDTDRLLEAVRYLQQNDPQPE